MASGPNNPARVLVLAPTAKDARTTQALLGQVGLICVLCKDVRDLAQHVRSGAEAALLTEEVITSEQVDELRQALSEQPPWSDLPLVLLASQFLPADASAIFSSFSNVTLLDRPTSMRTLVSAVQAAVRNRERQYQLRSALAEKQKALENEHAARSEAERANSIKDRFLAVLSHELRTPLTPVLACVSMLQRQPHFDASTRHSLELLRRNVELEARLIDDLLDVTRIANGKLQLTTQPIALPTVIGQAVDVCRPDIEARALHLDIDFEADERCMVEADAARLQQVFWNLIKNAIKFTAPGGRIGVRIRREGDVIVTEVKDTGIGIEPEALPRIFNAFAQADSAIARQFGGLGLGLAISRSIVDMHGGTIDAQSEGKGKGTTLRVRLPLLADTPHPIAPHGVVPPHSSCRLRILLVEDHGDTAEMMKLMLEAEGHEVATAGDVAGGLNAASTAPYDVLISDVGLPDGSGVDLIRQIRSRGQQIPAIALSGYGRDSDIEQSRAAGFTKHLVKPVDMDRLIEAVSLVLSSRAT